MSNIQRKKLIREKRRKNAKRLKIIKNVSIITFVIAAITLAVVLPTVLSDKDNNNNSENSINSDNTSESNVKYTLMNLEGAGCPSCEQLKPVISSIKTQYSGSVNVVSYDVNNSTKGASLGNEYNVSTIPTLIYLEDGNEVSRSEGYKSQSEIEEEFGRLGWI